MCRHYDTEEKFGRYTITSDQTERDEVYGEIKETIVTRNHDFTLLLGQPVSELAKAEFRAKKEDDIQRLLLLVSDHPGIEMEGILDGLSMSKSHALKLLREASALIRKEGAGVKGDPHRYYHGDYEVTA
jgi:hypothetical protein